MASVKVKFRPSSVNGREGSIYYQVIHNRAVRQITADLHVHESEWDNKKSAVKISEWASSGRRQYLQSVTERIQWDTKRLKAIAAFLDKQNRDDYTTDDIVGKFNAATNEQSLSGFMQGIISQLKRLNRIRTSETYAATLASFMKFRDGQDILLCEIDGDTMMLYEAWLKANGNCPNTTSFYMRILRAVYNRAVEKALTEQRHPFKHVYTGIDKTVKRAVPLKAIKRIKELDLTLKPHLDYARDMFLFSFYTRGMSFIDMAYLKKSDLKNGILIKWEKCMQEIVDKYDTESSIYLLPIIKPYSKTDERTQYIYAGHNINRSLKAIGKELGLSLPLTMYTSRHSWASIAKSKNVPLSVISEGMGHDSEATTRIYLASLDNMAIDKANSLILKSL